MPQLRQLVMSGSPRLRQFIAHVHMPALTYLKVGGRRMGAALNCISTLTGLRELGLRCEVKSQCTLDLHQLQFLTLLDLRSGSLPEESSLLRGATALRTLHMDGEAHRVDEVFVQAVSAMRNLRLLTLRDRGQAHPPMVLYGRLQALLLACGGRLEV